MDASHTLLDGPAELPPRHLPCCPPSIFRVLSMLTDNLSPPRGMHMLTATGGHSNTNPRDTLTLMTSERSRHKHQVQHKQSKWGHGNRPYRLEAEPGLTMRQPRTPPRQSPPTTLPRVGTGDPAKCVPPQDALPQWSPPTNAQPQAPPLHRMAEPPRMSLTAMRRYSGQPNTCPTCRKSPVDHPKNPEHPLLSPQ